MKWLLSLLLFSFPLTADYKTSKAYFNQIQKSIDKILSSVDQNVHVGVEVVSLRSGIRLYEKNAHQLFIPGSTCKLFTAGAALAELGPHYTFETSFLTEGAIKDNKLNGNLYLKGTGDPSFSLSDLENLVLYLRLNQVEEITGDIVIDNFAYDSYSQGPGWMWDDFSGFTFAPMNALSINHNVLDLWVRPAEGIATAPKVFAFPKTTFVQIENLATTDEKAETLTVERLAKGKGNTIQVKGEIGVQSDMKQFRVSLKSPHLYAATLLQSILKKAGIATKGIVKVEKTPLHAKIIAAHQSPPLAILLQTMLKKSDNLYADNFFKKIGQLRFEEQGNWKNGSQAVRHHLEITAGLDVSDLVILDGSGLSRYNLASPHHFVEYLTWIYEKFPYSAEYLASLSLAGKDGLLRNRFTNNQPMIRAKTGTMSGITAIAGYLQTADGEMLAFSILTNGFTSKAAKYKKEVEDQILTFLANLTRE